MPRHAHDVEWICFSRRPARRWHVLLRSRHVIDSICFRWRPVRRWFAISSTVRVRTAFQTRCALGFGRSPCTWPGHMLIQGKPQFLPKPQNPRASCFGNALSIRPAASEAEIEKEVGPPQGFFSFGNLGSGLVQRVTELSGRSCKNSTAPSRGDPDPCHATYRASLGGPDAPPQRHGHRRVPRLMREEQWSLCAYLRRVTA